MADLLRGNRVQCQLGGSGHLCECLHCCRDFWVEGQQRHAADRIVRTDCVVAFQYHDDVILKLTQLHAHAHIGQAGFQTLQEIQTLRCKLRPAGSSHETNWLWQDEFGVAGTPFAASAVAVVVAVVGIFMAVLRSDLVPWSKIQSRYDIQCKLLSWVGPKGTREVGQSFRFRLQGFWTRGLTDP